MGANPLGITVGLGFYRELSDVDWVEASISGMTECLQFYPTPIVGGDIVRSPVITLAITAFRALILIYSSDGMRRMSEIAIVVTGYRGLLVEVSDYSTSRKRRSSVTHRKAKFNSSPSNAQSTF